MKKKIIIIVFLCLIGITFNVYRYYKSYQVINANQAEIIKEVLDNPHKISNQQKFYGYLFIPKLKVKRIIHKAYEESKLDQGYINIFFNTNYLNTNIGHTLLVGHNNKGLFRDIKKLNDKDELYLYTENGTTVYSFLKKEIVSFDQYIYQYETKKHLLSLITCTSNSKKRLVVTFIENKLVEKNN